MIALSHCPSSSLSTLLPCSSNIQRTELDVHGGDVRSGPNRRGRWRPEASKGSRVFQSPCLCLLISFLTAALSFLVPTDTSIYCSSSLVSATFHLSIHLIPNQNPSHYTIDSKMYVVTKLHFSNCIKVIPRRLSFLPKSHYCLFIKELKDKNKFA